MSNAPHRDPCSLWAPISSPIVVAPLASVADAQVTPAFWARLASEHEQATANASRQIAAKRAIPCRAILISLTMPQNLRMPNLSSA